MSHITTEDPATLRLPFKEKLSYGIGDLASNILLDIGTLYLLKFYTDVLGLPGTYGGIIFLISKFFTAFTDMGTGIMLDSRRKIGPKGKFRPFILYASFPVTLLAIANFVGTPFDVTGKTVMATILFMLYGLFFSMMNCSYGAMVPAITKNPNERASLAAWRQGGATLGLLQSFRAIAGNRPLFILCIANLCTLGAFNVKLAIQVYYTQYVLNDPILLSYMGFFSMGCIFIGVFLMPASVRRFGKKKVYIGGLLIWVLGDLLNYFFGGGSVSFVAFSCLAFFGSAFVNSLNWALVSDTVEYGEWRTGVRSEGTVYTGFTFFRKVSQALAGFFPGWMLTQIGYVPNVAQADHTIEGLRQLIFIYPSALAVVTIVAMGCFYSLNEKMYVRIVEEIEARKRTA
ncbi:MFS transporter [Escherichia coli]|uniref:glycoside-pentoside-hexuronide (GPH):cation symporter n=1 Tax=Escherichia coli TaxID=562 RepID=UPI000750B1C0|nr:glycoside-pentoside-hexuronide (GPH):cation symporter [Escherichia coli]EEW0952844.1 MFS transporter [Escherichia coli]EFB9636331.1 MFS transporter [Escherichia coli]EIZ3917279.1 MFS transporter [Escherichia coli]EJA0954867.1 MFS transporter [Escherichia coli]EJA1246757.1 MFS transporter [Escherichia coli]